MALTDTDRRRFFLATTLTLLALPALWWANRSEHSTAPGIAVAGVDVGVDVGADHDGDAPGSTGTIDARTDEQPETGEISPVFLDGPSSAAGAGLSEVAVPARPAVARIFADATFRSDIGGSSSCVVPGVVNGRTVTIVNLDNGRSVPCTTTLSLSSESGQVTLHSTLFAQLADLTDAPIHVEIRR
ncbi:MAG: hypothetical protein WBP59_05895 [Ilumatobacteraceae bacterium]